MTHSMSSWKQVWLFLVALGGVASAQAPAAPEERIELEDDEGPRVEAPARGIELTNGIHAYGHLTAAYTRNLADEVQGRKGANALRQSDADHDTFGLTYVQLGLARDPSGKNELDAGFRVEVGFGRLVEESMQDDGLFDDQPIDLPQAYVTAQLPTPVGRPVTISAGRLGGWFGVEGNDLGENLNHSLGYLSALGGPGSITGASVAIDLADGLRYTQYVGNGWDVVVDTNDAKTVGGALEYALGALSLRGSWVLGAEGLEVSQKRWALGADVIYVSSIFGTELRASGLYGEEEGGALDGDLARFGGVSLAVKQGLCDAGGYDCVSIAVRGEWFRDQGGSRSGRDQALAGLTTTLEVRPLEALALRMEYRHDWSSEDAFGGSSSSSSSSSAGGEDEQDTVSASISLSF
jgi:hypothetical protein